MKIVRFTSLIRNLLAQSGKRRSLKIQTVFIFMKAICFGFVFTKEVEMLPLNLLSLQFCQELHHILWLTSFLKVKSRIQSKNWFLNSSNTNTSNNIHNSNSSSNHNYNNNNSNKCNNSNRSKKISTKLHNKMNSPILSSLISIPVKGVKENSIGWIIRIRITEIVTVLIRRII